MRSEIIRILVFAFLIGGWFAWHQYYVDGLKAMGKPDDLFNETLGAAVVLFAATILTFWLGRSQSKRR